MTVYLLICLLGNCRRISNAVRRLGRRNYLFGRQPIEIASVYAGSNEATAAKTFDDDETTDWSSDGTLSSAWINYSFKDPVTINEVVAEFVSLENAVVSDSHLG